MPLKFNQLSRSIQDAYKGRPEPTKVRGGVTDTGEWYSFMVGIQQPRHLWRFTATGWQKVER